MSRKLADEVGDFTNWLYWPVNFVLNLTGGVRGAGFIHSPLLSAKARVSMELMHVTDWLPTLYSIAGGDIKNLHSVDGYDMWNTLSQAIESPREEILHNIDPKKNGEAALRFRNWKLLVNISKQTYFSILKWQMYRGWSEVMVNVFDCREKNLWESRHKIFLW